MAIFSLAYKKTMTHEGGYANDPEDAGGETWKGISRVYHASWEGWHIIDSYKNQPNFPKNLEFASTKLQELVELQYKRMYWDVNRLDEMPQDVAEELFDTGVNLGVGRAAKYLQIALNCLNRNQDPGFYSDLVVDGNIGPKTLMALITLTTKAQNDKVVLLKMLNVLQGYHYIEYMGKSPTQEKYARGWYSRVEITKI